MASSFGRLSSHVATGHKVAGAYLSAQGCGEQCLITDPPVALPSGSLNRPRSFDLPLH